MNTVLKNNKAHVAGNGADRERDEFVNLQKERLLELKSQLIGRIEGSTKDVIRSTGDRDGMTTFGLHQADAGSDAYDCDFALNLLSKENDSVKQIDDALARIENGTYGICIDSGEEIPRERLEALPFAKRTIACQQKFEQDNKGSNSASAAPISSLFMQADVSNYKK